MANIEQVLTQIALTFNLDADELIAFSYEDELGGYHSAPSLATYPNGNIWGVEGRVLYALVRTTKPQAIYSSTEIDDCAKSHMGIAAAKNGNDAEFVSNTHAIDFAWLDNIHGIEDVRNFWHNISHIVNPGGFIVMHDATHFLVGAAIQEGIRASGVTGVQLYDIQPSDCGLAVWRKPGKPVKAEPEPDVFETVNKIRGYGNEADEYDRFIPVPEPTQPSVEFQGIDPYIIVGEKPNYDLDGMTRAELRAFAEDHGIDLGDLRAKTDIRAAIDDALKDGD